MATHHERHEIQMRAAIFQAEGSSLTIGEVADPSPGPGQVVVKVERCGICTSDLHMALGHAYPFKPGAIPGHEIAGEVVAFAADVGGLSEGDRVTVMPYLGCGGCPACWAGEPVRCPRRQVIGFTAYGGYAEFVLADARFCLVLPATMSPADGALVEPFAVALRANRASGLKTGDRVLILGAGPIGMASLYWARASGASRIAMVATSDRRKSIAEAIGVDSFLAGEPDDTEQRFASALGGAPDLVLECSGAPGALDLAVLASRRNGTVCAPGACWMPAPFNALAAMIKEITIRFTNTYDRSDFERACEALDGNGLDHRAVITSTISLDDTPAVFEQLKRPNAECKVHIRP
jgi:2-desacetyl-2-hydroxyethyl bacteriochlorophyllide A dehydrogenase